VRVYNVDISSCDKGNGPLMFSILGTLLSQINESRALMLISQCQLPIWFVNPSALDEKLVVEFDSCFEGSGTVLTTVLNHIAMLMIVCASASLLQRDTNVLNIVDILQAGALLVGHAVTVDDTGGVIEKIQFLKHSPMLCTDGLYHAVRNFGCILRNLGTCEGDLTSTQLNMSYQQFKLLPIADRCDIYVSQQIAGLVHEPGNCILTALRERFHTPVEHSINEHYFNNEGECGLELVQESLVNRYGGDEWEYEYLTSSLRSIAIGDMISSTLVEKFFAIDYGL